MLKMPCRKYGWRVAFSIAAVQYRLSLAVAGCRSTYLPLFCMHHV